MANIIEEIGVKDMTRGRIYIILDPTIILRSCEINGDMHPHNRGSFLYERLNALVAKVKRIKSLSEGSDTSFYFMCQEELEKILKYLVSNSNDIDELTTCVMDKPEVIADTQLHFKPGDVHSLTDYTYILNLRTDKQEALVIDAQDRYIVIPYGSIETFNFGCWDLQSITDTVNEEGEKEKEAGGENVSSCLTKFYFISPSQIINVLRTLFITPAQMLDLNTTVAIAPNSDAQPIEVTIGEMLCFLNYSYQSLQERYVATIHRLKEKNK